MDVNSGAIDELAENDDDDDEEQILPAKIKEIKESR